MSFVPRSYWPTTGWVTAHPESQGLNSQQLQRTVDHIRDQLPYLTSLLIVRHGLLVMEYYAPTFGPAQAYNTQSVTKSLISTLVGVAVDRGHLALDQPMLAFFPEYASVILDARMRQVTIRHLLTMSAGLPTELGNAELWDGWIDSADHIQFALTQTLVAEPGAAFHYSNIGSHLISAILTRATSTPTLDFANQTFGAHIGLTIADWPRDAQGYYFGCGWAQMTARDMAKFGYLYLNQGLWDGQALIPAPWVAESTTAQIAGYEWMEQIPGYGYLWWITEEADHQAYYATGYGGQYIAVIPDLDLVVVMTGQAYEEYVYHRYIIPEYIIPAAEG